MSYSLIKLREEAEEAKRLLSINDLEKAELKLISILDKFPDEPDVLYNLAEIHRKKNSYTLAIKNYKKSIEIESNNSKSILGLSYCLMNQGDYSLAEEWLLKSLTFEQSSYDACRSIYLNLFVIAVHQNNKKNIKKYGNEIALLIDDIAELERVIREYCLLLEAEDVVEFVGLVTSREKQVDLFKKAIVFGGSSLDFNVILEAVKNLCGEHIDYWICECIVGEVIINHDMIKKSAEKVLKEEPTNYQAYSFLATALLREKKFRESMTCAELGLTFSKSDEILLYCLASSAFSLGLFCISVINFRKVLQVNPNNKDAIFGLANIYKLHRMFKLELETIEDFYRPFTLGLKEKIENNYELDALNACVISGAGILDLVDVENAKSVLSKSILNYDFRKESNLSLKKIGSFALQVITDDVSLYNDIVRKYYPFKKAIKSRNPHSRSSSKKLKVGYMSADFKRHSVGLLISSVLVNHSSNIELYIFSLDKSDDLIHKSIREVGGKNFYDLSELSDSESADLIEAHEIDILVDLMGETTKNRNGILAYNPAPIQMHMMGQCASLCSDNVNYFLASEHFVKNGDFDTAFNENILVLPDVHVSVDKFYEPSSIPSKKELGLPEDKFILYSFATWYRIDKNYIESIARILSSTNNTIIWMKVLNANVKDIISKHFQKLGVSTDRLYFDMSETLTGKWQHKQADLFLDTFSVSGGTTILLSIQAGLPVIAMEGNAPWQRHASAILRDCELDRLVATSKEEYIEKCINLASDKDLYDNMKKELITKSNTSKLFKAKEYVKDLELGYKKIWKHYIEGSKEKVIRL